MSKPQNKKLTLPASAFETEHKRLRLTPKSIIDAHVHLWSGTQRDAMDWLKDDDQVLLSQDYSLGRYRAIVASREIVENCVYIQAGVRSDWKDEGQGWDASIEEISWISKTASLKLGASPEILSIVPWAPVPGGKQVLSRYLKKIDQVSAHAPISAFRYNLEKFPLAQQVQHTPEFIDGIAFLIEKGYGFEFIVNCHAWGPRALDEVLKTIDNVESKLKENGSEQKGKYIIDHLGKPDLSNLHNSNDLLSNSDDEDNAAKLWLRTLTELSFLPNAYIKLSGLINECDPKMVKDAFQDYCQGKNRTSSSSTSSLKRTLSAVISPVLEAFGFERILFGSDYPMFRPCIVPNPSSTPTPNNSTPSFMPTLGGNIDVADQERKEYDFVLSLLLSTLVDLGIEGESLDAIFSDNARRIYTPVVE